MTQELGDKATAQERTLLNTDCFLNDATEIILKSFVNQTLVSKHIVQSQHIDK